MVGAPGSVGSAGGAGSFGPFVVNITLNEVRTHLRLPSMLSSTCWVATWALAGLSSMEHKQSRVGQGNFAGKSVEHGLRVYTNALVAGK